MTIVHLFIENWTFIVGVLFVWGVHVKKYIILYLLIKLVLSFHISFAVYHKTSDINDIDLVY